MEGGNTQKGTGDVEYPKMVQPQRHGFFRGNYSSDTSTYTPKPIMDGEWYTDWYQRLVSVVLDDGPQFQSRDFGSDNASCYRENYVRDW